MRLVLFALAVDARRRARILWARANVLMLRVQRAWPE